MRCNAIAFLTLAQGLKLQLKMANRLSKKKTQSKTIKKYCVAVACQKNTKKAKHTRRDTLYEGGSRIS